MQTRPTCESSEVRPARPRTTWAFFLARKSAEALYSPAMAEDKEVRASLLLPAKVWRAIRKAAIDEDRPLKAVVREALEAYLKRRS